MCLLTNLLSWDVWEWFWYSFPIFPFVLISILFPAGHSHFCSYCMVNPQICYANFQIWSTLDSGMSRMRQKFGGVTFAGIRAKSRNRCNRVRAGAGGGIAPLTCCEMFSKSYKHTSRLVIVIINCHFPCFWLFPFLFLLHGGVREGVEGRVPLWHALAYFLDLMNTHHISLLLLLTGIFRVFRYGQFDPFDRPHASLGYNMDDSEFANDYSRAPMNDSYDQLYSQQRPNRHTDYYGYGNR